METFACAWCEKKHGDNGAYFMYQDKNGGEKRRLSWCSTECYRKWQEAHPHEVLTAIRK